MVVGKFDVKTILLYGKTVLNFLPKNIFLILPETAIKRNWTLFLVVTALR